MVNIDLITKDYVIFDLNSKGVFKKSGIFKDCECNFSNYEEFLSIFLKECCVLPYSKKLISLKTFYDKALKFNNINNFDSFGMVAGNSIIYNNTYYFIHEKVIDDIIVIFLLPVDSESCDIENMLRDLYLDPLGGILNRKSIIEILQKEVALSLRYKLPLSIGIIDIDNFKKLNDFYGHIVGDEVIKHVCSTIKSIIRKSDSVGRYGGEEFLLIMPNTNLSNSYVACEKIRYSIFNKPFVFKDITLFVSVSIGVTSLRSEEAQNKEFDIFEFISRADKALYKAKANGKNQVFIEP